MPKRAVSVTLEEANLVWLKARAGAGGTRSVSALLDRLVSDARRGGAAQEPTSVVGTIDISGSDPLLLRSDDAVTAMLRSSLERPLLVQEPKGRHRARKRVQGRRG